MQLTNLLVLFADQGDGPIENGRQSALGGGKSEQSAVSPAFASSWQAPRRAPQTQSLLLILAPKLVQLRLLFPRRLPPAATAVRFPAPVRQDLQGCQLSKLPVVDDEFSDHTT